MTDVNSAPDPQSTGPSGAQATPSASLNETEKTSRNWSMFCHLAALIGLCINIGTATFFFPLCFVGPLVVWLVRKHEYPAVDEHGREAANFQITMSGLQFLFFLIPVIGWFIFLPLLIVFNLGISIFASVKASHGERFRYPISLRLLN